MNSLIFLLDVPPQPFERGGIGVVFLLLAAVLALAVSFVAALVFLLIRYKRRSLSTQESKPVVGVQNLTQAE